MYPSPANDSDQQSDTLAMMLGGLLSGMLSPRRNSGKVVHLDMLAGIAVVGNVAAGTGEGIWQWTAPSEAGWHAIGEVSTREALILPAQARLRYMTSRLPSGKVPALVVHLIDWSAGRVWVQKGLDINAALRDSNSAISHGVVVLSADHVQRPDR